MKPIALSNARQSALETVGVALGNDFTPSSISSGDVGGYHGQVGLANDSLLRTGEYIEEITSWAIGYDGMAGNKLARLRDFLVPPRTTTSRMVRLMTYDENEPWQTVDYTKVKRGMLADFMRVRQRNATKSDFQVPNRGLTVLLDRDQLKDKPDWQQLHTKWLIDLMTRATVLEAIALYQSNATSYSTTWDSAANPDLELKQDILNLANTTGFYPTRAIYGDQAALKRQLSYAGQLTAGSLASYAQLTEEQIAASVGVDQVIVNAERYQVASGTAKQEIVGSNVILFSAVDGAPPTDPTNIVRHVSSGANGGGEYAVYVNDIGVKLVALTVENYEYLHVQHTTGLQQVQVN